MQKKDVLALRYDRKGKKCLRKRRPESRPVLQAQRGNLGNFGRAQRGDVSWSTKMCRVETKSQELIVGNNASYFGRAVSVSRQP